MFPFTLSFAVAPASVYESPTVKLTGLLPTNVIIGAVVSSACVLVAKFAVTLILPVTFVSVLGFVVELSLQFTK